jgi:hypothetical protein
MEVTDPILQEVANIVSESMGQSAGEDFFELYKYEDRTEIINGAKALLNQLIGPDQVEKKLSKIKVESKV